MRHVDGNLLTLSSRSADGGERQPDQERALPVDPILSGSHSPAIL